MFKENKRLAAADTLIGQGTLVEGKLLCEAGLRIEGEYRGDIECRGDLIIGECGTARSNITAKDITLAGKLYGDIIVSGRLTITATGELSGNVKANSIIIHDGGILDGSCRMERVSDSRTRSLTEGQPSASASAAAGGQGTEAKEAHGKARQAG
ncbi:polymer-forming cytoskeletal protein [Paenibacillus sp. GCM10023252]|uniref:bactofilin family protein n=1 Tax=Paenibacillus sp. GCM10023252 TaxID=3252649 RepID=UPI0036238E5D